MQDSLGDRMKEFYEARSRYKLLRKVPVIIRLDGKAFHTYTSGFRKPYDQYITTGMNYTLGMLMNNIQGAKLGYTQSDEISILLTDDDRITTDSWFDYNLQKIISVAASMCTAYFNKKMYDSVFCEEQNGNKHPAKDKYAFFDARAFNVPENEVPNYFVWRQKDCIRNSVSSLAQCHFSHRELQRKNTIEMKGMLMGIGEDWINTPEFFRYGYFVGKNLQRYTEEFKYEDIKNLIKKEEEEENNEGTSQD